MYIKGWFWIDVWIEKTQNRIHLVELQLTLLKTGTYIHTYFGHDYVQISDNDEQSKARKIVNFSLPKCVNFENRFLRIKFYLSVKRCNLGTSRYSLELQLSLVRESRDPMDPPLKSSMKFSNWISYLDDQSTFELLKYRHLKKEFNI